VLFHGVGLFVLAEGEQFAVEASGGRKGVGMVLAENATAAFESVLVEVAGFFVLAETRQSIGEVVG
jgi:hypothetical protein